jgi:hypothetical protein
VAKIVGDKTFVAQWRTSGCQSTFHPENGGPDIVVVKNAGEYFGQLPEVARNGYAYAGWWT